MAIDGTYEISIQTPMGVQKGRLVLKTFRGTLTGTSEGATGIDPIQNGKVRGDEFEGMVETKSPMGSRKV
jgi:hypothetical protein